MNVAVGGLVIEGEVEAGVSVARRIGERLAHAVQQHGVAGVVDEVGMEVAVETARHDERHIHVRDAFDGRGDVHAVGKAHGRAVGNAEVDRIADVGDQEGCHHDVKTARRGVTTAVGGGAGHEIGSQREG